MTFNLLLPTFQMSYTLIHWFLDGSDCVGEGQKPGKKGDLHATFYSLKESQVQRVKKISWRWASSQKGYDWMGHHQFWLFFFSRLEAFELEELLLEEGDLLLLDFALLFFTFLARLGSTFSSSRSRKRMTKRRKMKMKKRKTDFCVFFFWVITQIPLSSELRAVIFPEYPSFYQCPFLPHSLH